MFGISSRGEAQFNRYDSCKKKKQDSEMSRNEGFCNSHTGFAAPLHAATLCRDWSRQKAPEGNPISTEQCLTCL